MKKNKDIPKMSSYKEMGEFWDEHSLADYWNQTEPVEFQVSSNLRSHYLVPVDSDLFKRVQQIAGIRGISIESLINLLLEQRVSEIVRESTSSKSSK